MKWVSCMSGELNNCAVYFSRGSEATQHPWNYQQGIETAKQVEGFKDSRDPDGKQRGEVPKFIAKKSQGRNLNPTWKIVDCVKAQPLHNTNNAWQQWFLAVLTVVMQYTSQFQLQASTVVLDLLITSPLVISVMCVCETVKCGRLYNSSSSGSVKKGKNLVLLQVHWD